MTTMSVAFEAPKHPQYGYVKMAPFYLQAGHLPVPLNGKVLAVKWATGYNGTVTPEKVAKWRVDWGYCNTALRLPMGQLGLDVDDAAQLDILVKLLGPLPATVSSTSRGQGHPRRTYLFTVPDHLHFVGNPAIPGVAKDKVDIDIISLGHRYLAVAPSVHPITGDSYAWYAADGQDMGQVIPAVSEFAALPQAWVDHLSKVHVDRDTAAYQGTMDVEAWLGDGEPGSWALTLLDKIVSTTHVGHSELLHFVRELRDLRDMHEHGLAQVNRALFERLLATSSETNSRADLDREFENVWRFILGEEWVPDELGAPLSDWANGIRSNEHWDAYYEAPKVKTPEEKAEASKAKFLEDVQETLYRRQVVQEAERLLGAEGYLGTVELSWDDMDGAHQTYIVEDFLPDDAVCFLVAKGNIGKTFTYLDMILSMACGLSWLGKATRQAKTLVVLGEGRNGFIDRIRAWCTAKGKNVADLKPWVFFMDGANLNNDESLARIKEVLDRESIELAVWDTWANVSGIIKEEDNGLNNVTMSRVLNLRPGMSNLFIHHPRKAEENTDAPVMRGAGSLFGRADVVMTMWRDHKYIPSSGEKHEYLALSTEAAHEGKNRSSGTETVRGLYLAEHGDSLALEQVQSEAISKMARGVKEHLDGPMSVKEYAAKAGMSEATARRHLLKAVEDGVALQHKSEVSTWPDQFSPVTVPAPVKTDWAGMVAAQPAPTMQKVATLEPQGNQPVAPLPPAGLRKTRE